PHNPSATVVERDFFVEVVKLARRFGFMIVHDFAYGDVCFDGYRAPSFLSVPGALEVGVETTTMSKGYNMAGWRLGFCCGNAEMVRALATIKGYYDYGIFQAIQVAAIIALRECEDLVRRQSLEYQKRRDVLLERLRRIGWEAERPRAGRVVWPRAAREVKRAGGESRPAVQGRRLLQGLGGGRLSDEPAESNLFIGRNRVRGVAPDRPMNRFDSADQRV